MKLSDLKRIVDLLVEEGCGECEVFDHLKFEKLFAYAWFIDDRVSFGEKPENQERGFLDNEDYRAKLVSFLKENFK